MNISEEELRQIQQVAKYSVIEPFEGRPEYKALLDAKSKLQQGVGYFSTQKEKSISYLKKLKLPSKKSKSESAVIKHPLDKSLLELNFESFNHQVTELTKDFGKNLKSKYDSYENRIKKLLFEYVEKVFDLIFVESNEKWICERANIVLSKQFSSMGEIRSLNSPDRELLVEKLYPYDKNSLIQWKGILNISLNLGLGTIVVSNLPFTGMLASAINIAKTLAKIARQLNLMISIYGYEVANRDSLFRVSGLILASLEDWETNEKHIPLGLNKLDNVFQKESNEDGGIKELLNASLKKDAYMAIPGIGMISLGKLQLDDNKLDLKIYQYVKSYFDRKKLLEKKVSIENQEKLFFKIYKTLKEKRYIQKTYEQLNASRKSKFSKFKLGFSRFSNKDSYAEAIHHEMDSLAFQIYNDVSELEEEMIEEEVQKKLSWLN